MRAEDAESTDFKTLRSEKFGLPTVPPDTGNDTPNENEYMLIELVGPSPGIDGIVRLKVLAACTEPVNKANDDRSEKNVTFLNKGTEIML